MDVKYTKIRTHIYDFEKLMNYLSEISDHEIVDGYIFSRVFKNYENYVDFVGKLDVDEEVKKDFVEMYDEKYFVDKSLLVMFSDERSGGNRLELVSENIKDGLLSIVIERERGFTMDMAYLFMFYEIQKDVERSQVLVRDKQILL